MLYEKFSKCYKNKTLIHDQIKLLNIERSVFEKDNKTVTYKFLLICVISTNFTYLLQEKFNLICLDFELN